MDWLINERHLANFNFIPFIAVKRCSLRLHMTSLNFKLIGYELCFITQVELLDVVGERLGEVRRSYFFLPFPRSLAAVSTTNPSGSKPASLRQGRFIVPRQCEGPLNSTLRNYCFVEESCYTLFGT